jgi:hypothetical protein
MMGTMECLVRDLTGDQRLTVGEILKQGPGLLLSHCTQLPKNALVGPETALNSRNLPS